MSVLFFKFTSSYPLRFWSDQEHIVQITLRCKNIIPRKRFLDRNFHLNIFRLSLCCRKTTIVITSVEILATLLPQPPPPSLTPTTTFNVDSRTYESHPSGTVMCPLNAGRPLNRSHNL